MKKILIIIILGLLIYSYSLFNGFVWDDEEQIVNNVFVHSVNNIPILFKTSTFNSGGAGILSGTYYRPLMMTFFSFVYQIFGPNPFFFHFFQLVFHIATTVLIYYFLKYFFKKKLSLILAIIFLVHPVNVEAVAYISAIQDIFYVLFGLLAFYFVIQDKDKFNFKNIFLINLFLFLSLLSKETAFLFFILIFLYQFIFRKKNIFEHIVFFSITIASYLILRLAVAGVFFTPYHFAPIVQLNFWQRTLMVPNIFIHYLSVFFYPVKLAVMQHWVLKTISFSGFYVPLIFVTLFLLATITFFLKITKGENKSSRNIFLFFTSWFFITIFPYLQLFPLDMTVADRWFYLPMIGLLGMIGAMLSFWQGRSPRPESVSDSGVAPFPRMTIYISIIIICLFSMRSFIRTLDWKNGLTLYSKDNIIVQDSFDLENNYGVELFRRGNFNDAKIHFEKSTKLAPHWWTNWNNLGAVYEREKNYQKAAKYYQKAIDNGQYYLAYENLAKILVAHGKDQNKTKEFLQKALVNFPENQNLQLINIYFQENNKK